jgi:hypothetical protein
MLLPMTVQAVFLTNPPALRHPYILLNSSTVALKTLAWVYIFSTLWSSVLLFQRATWVEYIPLLRDTLKRSATTMLDPSSFWMVLRVHCMW